MPTVLNAANEITVNLFLNKKISFLDIGNINEKIMLQHSPVKIDSIETILEAQKWTEMKIMQNFN